jgi:hypothetical protein
VLKTKRLGPIPIPTLKLRSKNLTGLFVLSMPLVLMFFSWVLIWYYSWFVPMVLLLKTPDEMMRYRWMIAAVWVAHFVGIALNLQYFLAGPIAEFFGHLKL